MTTDAPSITTEFLNDEQKARVGALRVAHPFLRATGGMFGPTTPGAVTDLVDLAEYIVRGLHPHDRYTTDEGTVPFCAEHGLFHHCEQVVSERPRSHGDVEEGAQ